MGPKEVVNVIARVNPHVGQNVARVEHTRAKECWRRR